MDDMLAILLLVGTLVGGVLLAMYLCLLPPKVFLRGEPWLTEEQLREVAPGKAWCRHLPASVAIMFPTYVGLFLAVQYTCNNQAPMLLAFVPLYFLWLYVPVGLVELLAGVSVLVPVGRSRSTKPVYVVGPRVARAGAFRLAVTGAVLTALLVVAYW
jgi:hypothetical protein